MIRELSALYSISEICEALNVSRSGYHGAEQRQKKPSRREVQNEHLNEHDRESLPRESSLLREPPSDSPVAFAGRNLFGESGGSIDAPKGA